MTRAQGFGIVAKDPGKPPQPGSISFRRNDEHLWLRAPGAELVNPGPTGEPLQDELATAIELEAALDAQVAHERRREDLSGIGGGADPTGEGHGGAEEVVVVVDRLARGQPDPHPEDRRRRDGCASP